MWVGGGHFSCLMKLYSRVFTRRLVKHKLEEWKEKQVLVKKIKINTMNPKSYADFLPKIKKKMQQSFLIEGLVLIFIYHQSCNKLV